MGREGGSSGGASSFNHASRELQCLHLVKTIFMCLNVIFVAVIIEGDYVKCIDSSESPWVSKEALEKEEKCTLSEDSKKI